MAIKAPSLQWDYGTAYELFASLLVLHTPDKFGIRPSFAAGVRSRIPPTERKLLEDVYPFTGLPLRWLHTLPAPKDAISALWALKQIPPAERVIKLPMLDDPAPYPSSDPEEAEKHKRWKEILLRVPAERKWKQEDAEYLQKLASKYENYKKDTITRFLDWWKQPEELGEGFLSALQSYYHSFFEEEEKRIEPALKAGLERAQALAPKMSVDDLFVELSQGVKLEDEFRVPKLIFAPTFWSTPLILFEKLQSDTMLILFGVRPPEMSVIPGEVVPDGLVRALKALADPTRLKILNYLAKEELAPSELARRLKLRAPTVTHHMSELRLAGLVNVLVQGSEKKYTARMEAVDTIHKNLKDFINASSE